MKDMPTPETDSWFNRDMHTLSPAKNKMKDLERRLSVAREALKRVTMWSTENTVLDVARQAITLTAPKP